MEGNSGGPTNTNTNTRPVRNASRYFYNHHNSSSQASFSGPVRRWEKKWVHVSSSQPSIKPRKYFLSNASKSSTSPILLCKWTPLSRPPTTTADVTSAASRRKFRYTPITVFEEKKKLISKGVSNEYKSGQNNQPKDGSDMENDDIYGLPDINCDFMGVRQRTNEGDLTYSRRSQLNLGLHLENPNQGGQSDLNVKRFWAMN